MPNNRTFLSSTGVAVYGVSPNRKTFASVVFNNIEKSGLNAFRINPSGTNGFYRDLNAVSDKVDSTYVAMRPEKVSGILDEIIRSGIKKVWLQNGSYNKDFINKLQSAGIETYTGCLMMYLSSAGFLHKFHRAIYEFFGGDK